MVSGSRAPDLLGQIWCGLRVVLLSSWLWLELRREETFPSGISNNKVDDGSFFARVVWRAAGRYLRISPQGSMVQDEGEIP